MSLLGAAGKDARDSRSEPPAHDQRFPRSCRLRSRRQFVEVYTKGRRVGSSSFTIFGLPNNLGFCRLGLTVPRKVGDSVMRNRVKRLLRELFRRQRVRLEPHMDLVVNAHPPITGRSLVELEREFRRSFSVLAGRNCR